MGALVRSRAPANANGCNAVSVMTWSKKLSTNFWTNKLLEEGEENSRNSLSIVVFNFGGIEDWIPILEDFRTFFLSSMSLSVHVSLIPPDVVSAVTAVLTPVDVVVDVVLEAPAVLIRFDEVVGQPKERDGTEDVRNKNVALILRRVSHSSETDWEGVATMGRGGCGLALTSGGDFKFRSG